MKQEFVLVAPIPKVPGNPTLAECVVKMFRSLEVAQEFVALNPTFQIVEVGIRDL